ncbi:hypothetical protein PEBR_20199 [Penicillium brasilianum]|uniref:FCP1 homology domain-containing protein n=1 Tax=Penicillium brasilianum TaxID=104259 RepID=A0A1S9RQ64_PENBI|nr:hypothetical protein PEBR_20199 [Penicillium brasilianum]
MSRSTCPARSWNLLAQSRRRGYSAQTIRLITHSVRTRDTTNSLLREHRSIVRNSEISSKLARNKQKRQKRAHDAADLAGPVQLSQYANAPEVMMGDMQGGQKKKPLWPAQMPAFNGSAGGQDLPHETSHNAAEVGDHGMQGNPMMPYESGAAANASGFYAAIPMSNNPASQIANDGGKLPSGNSPASPSNAFGAFNVPSWNPVNGNSQSMITPQLQKPFPFFNPMFSSQYSMGNFPPFPMMPPFNPMFPMQTQNMSTMAGSTGQLPNTVQPRRARSPTPPMKRPSPTKEYMLQASKPPQRSPTRRPLLVILDLNGTLIFRKHRKLPPVFARRHGLDEFLDELTSRYAVMIWTSSKPPTLDAICNKLFPGEKRKSMVALWGRDKFGLTQTQYNAKLQVYKELRKVWASSEIQAVYPGNEGVKQPPPPKQSGGKNSKKNRNRQQAGTFPPGQRWDQTNTILIDDSKLKALSEPFNILEIPEFTNDRNIDESKLFTKVLAKLDVLARHDDVSKVLRQWNERVAQGEASILDLDLGPEEEFDDEEDGGTSLLATTAPGTSANPIDLDIRSSLAVQLDPKEATRLRRKARKKEKKAAKAAIAAANQLIHKPQSQAQSSTKASGNADPASPKAAGVTKPSRRKKGKTKPLWAQEPDVERELEPNAHVNTIENAGGKRYSLRRRVQSNSEAATEPLDNQERLRHDHQDLSDRRSVSPVTDDGRRSVSPTTSTASRNTLLDNLEEGLGIKPKRRR